MTTNPAAAITKAASPQTYYTICFLVDRARVNNAYRAYAYFRGVDDLLDAESGAQPERLAFLQQQQELLERCYRGEAPREVSIQEQMLVELVRRNPEANSGLAAYLRNMMQVMEFDARRGSTPPWLPPDRIP